MQPVMTSQATAELDAAYPGDPSLLMERAGLAVAIEAATMGAGYGHRVVVLAGPGNNGGDGYVAARHLRRRGCQVTVHAFGEPRTDPAAAAAADATASGVRVVMGEEVASDHDLVVDALFGGGFRGELPDTVRAWSQHARRVLAVDVPSGLDGTTGQAADGTFRAERTVTFHTTKVGHLLDAGPDHTGALKVADIGLKGGQAAFSLVDDEDIHLPARSRTIHKWSAGAVLVAGGKSDMAGAAYLAARAALTGGAGAVAVAAPPESIDSYRARPELLTAELSGHDRSGARELLGAADRFDVIIVGPGLGAGVEEFVGTILAEAEQTVVLDADGLNALADLSLLEKRGSRTIVTPHAGEFRRLTGAPGDHHRVGELAEQTGATVLLKGYPTFVAGAQLFAITSGGPELATIGTGDVLAGMIAALAARGLPPVKAAYTAAHLHGRAGRVLTETGTVTADRLAEAAGGWMW